MNDMLQKAREYEKNKELEIGKEQRPAFHITPRIGWMNDPNGFSFYKGMYHLFYQYHPYTTNWGPMHWGHVVSKDLVHWDYLPAALAPDSTFDEKGCFSGSALELEDGRHLLLYTGVTCKKDESGEEHDYQTQCVAVGDGLEYEKYDNNPVLDQKDLPEGFSAFDFRDPKIWKKPEGGYGCVVGNRTDDGSGALLVFESRDGFQWHFEKLLDRCNNQYGRMWECPDYFVLDGKETIIVSPQEMKAEDYEFHCGDGTMCIAGEYDEKNGSFRREIIQAVDYGTDFYAPQTVETVDGRRVMIGWLQNWSTTGMVPDGAKWFGQMSIPREINWKDGRLVQRPVREFESVRENCISYADIDVDGETSLQGVNGRILDMELNIKPNEGAMYSFFRIKLAKGDGYYTSLEYNPYTSVLKLDRSHSGCNRDFAHQRECLVCNSNGNLKLRIIMDRFSIEVFANDGEQVMSMAVYTPQTADGISFEALGKARIDVKKYELNV